MRTDCSLCRRTTHAPRAVSGLVRVSWATVRAWATVAGHEFALHAARLARSRAPWPMWPKLRRGHVYARQCGHVCAGVRAMRPSKPWAMWATPYRGSPNPIQSFVLSWPKPWPKIGTVAQIGQGSVVSA